MADIKPYYPVMLDIVGWECLVVGGGRIAQRKLISLLECGAKVTVVSPAVTSVITELADSRSLKWIKRDYCIGDAEGFRLVVTATDDREVNAAAACEAKALGAMVNAIDDAELCDYIVPSVLRRGSLIIAVSTSGTDPALAKKIRMELEEMF